MRLRLLLSLVLLAPAAQANMASPEEPGTPAGEPAADLAGLRIARETLTLDLRALAQTRLATVDAEYRIVNAGPSRVVPLQFVALGPSVRPAEVWLDGRPVPSLPMGAVRVPPEWALAAETPALDGDPVPYLADDDLARASGVAFVVTIPPGQHSVRVVYGLHPGSYDDGSHPNRVWQLAYSLAPARRWAGFGQLDVRVVVPPGWDAAASLPMRRDGDTLVGRYPGVPGDVLSVSVRAPSPALRIPFRVAGVLAALVVVGFVGVVAGRLVARSGRRARAALPASVLAGVLGGVTLVAFVGIGEDLGDSSAYGYGAIQRLLFVGGPLAMAVGTGLAQSLATWAARRWRTPAPDRLAASPRQTTA